MGAFFQVLPILTLLLVPLSKTNWLIKSFVHWAASDLLKNVFIFLELKFVSSVIQILMISCLQFYDRE